MNTPYIESLKKYDANLNEKHLLSLYTDTPFGNMTRKWFDIVLRIDCINDNIDQVYKAFNIGKVAREISLDIPQLEMPKFHSSQKFLMEQIIYWLRKTMDELIGILYLSNYRKANNKYPQSIKISSIGELLRTQSDFDNIFEPHRGFLQDLNHVSNAYKHSFVNHEVFDHHGINEPVVFALRLDYNKIVNNQFFYTLSLSTLLKEFDLLLGKIKEKLSIEFTYR